MGQITTNGVSSATSFLYSAKRLYNLRAWTPKLLFGRLCFLFLVLIIGAAVFSLANNKNNGPTVAISKDPCAFFTTSDAKKVLGDKVQKGGTPSIAMASSKDREVITCIYTQDIKQGAQLMNVKSASVLLVSPKNSSGKANNEYEFGSGRPKGAQDVGGVGEKAFWDPALGTLNVLENGKWLIISNGVTAPASARSINETKKFADIIVPKL